MQAPDPEPKGPGAPDEPSSRYEILAKIASGGMATVFVARVRGAVGFSRLVALKRPHPFVSEDPVLRKGLEHEARVASMIHHPHVAAVLDVELLGDQLTLVLDYVDGGTLSDLLKHAEQEDTHLPTGVAIRIILDVASGLHAAHLLRDSSGAVLGIVHRDVSPQNILVGQDGQARLTDFGIAKITTQLDHTATNVIKGKLEYLPPEYLDGREFDTRSDEYALAVVAWEALAGSRLFRGGSDVETLRRIVERGAPPLSSARADLAALDAVLARGLARDPRLRFESVSAFADALEACAREHGWVAPYGDVAAAVEAAVGAKVRERQALVESFVSRPSASVSASNERARLASARDAMATLSLHTMFPELPSDGPSAEGAATGRSRSRIGAPIALGVALAAALGALGIAHVVRPREGAPAAAEVPPETTASIATSPVTIAPPLFELPPDPSVSNSGPAPASSSTAAPARPHPLPAHTPPTPRPAPSARHKNGVLFQDPD